MGTGTWRGWLGIGLLAAVGLVGCGGSGGADGNNDQGIVFRAVSFVRGPESIDDNQIRCTEPTTQNAIIDSAWVIRLDDQTFFPNRNDPFGNPCGGYIALENNLFEMAINVQEITVQYEIPGAGISPPENSISSGIRVNPTNTLDESSSGQPNLVYAQLVGQMLPEQIMTWLEQNRNVLPATPYSMNAFFRARGQADNGTRYTTNEIGYQFTITR